MARLLLPIWMPLLAALPVLAARRSSRTAAWLGVAATFGNLVLAIRLFGDTAAAVLPWGPFEFALRLSPFSGFMVAAVAGFSFLISLYASGFLRGHPRAAEFQALTLLTAGLVNGALLADDLLVLLFFWEATLVPLYAMIAIGRAQAWKTATKAFLIIGVSDLCLLVGVALTGHLAGSLSLSEVHLEVRGLAGVAMVLMLIGALAKAGAMPFHTWIPDAAEDAPLPFMALLPGSLEKLLGIYLLARICLDLFHLEPNSWMSYLLMFVGCGTILLAVMMALVQKDYKRLLAYHAVSQVGYMVLGLGTALPAGVVGGLFHMFNNALYKSCLFLTAGAVEKQAGSTDLRALGGLARRMPITFVCFCTAAAAIAGVPPLNGFFSKELVYDAAAERGTLFYVAALLGSFFTAASFLKLGHAAYLGARRPEHAAVRDPAAVLLVPMLVLPAACVLCGVWNGLPVDRLILPAVNGTAFAATPEHASELAGGHLSGWPASVLLVGMTLACLCGAVLNHICGVRVSGSGLHAADHIHDTPGLAGIYRRAAQRWFDPYELGLKAVAWLARRGWLADRAVDAVLERGIVPLTSRCAAAMAAVQSENYSWYIVCSLVGGVLLALLLLTGWA